MASHAPESASVYFIKKNCTSVEGLVASWLEYFFFLIFLFFIFYSLFLKN